MSVAINRGYSLGRSG